MLLEELKEIENQLIVKLKSLIEPCYEIIDKEKYHSSKSSFYNYKNEIDIDDEDILYIFDIYPSEEFPLDNSLKRITAYYDTNNDIALVLVNKDEKDFLPKNELATLNTSFKFKKSTFIPNFCEYRLSKKDEEIIDQLCSKLFDQKDVTDLSLNLHSAEDSGDIFSLYADNVLGHENPIRFIKENYIQYQTDFSCGEVITMNYSDGKFISKISH